MRYDLKEILSVTSSYLFVNKGGNIWDKKYRPTILPKEIAPDKDIIYIPFASVVNKIPTETYSDIEIAIRKGARAFMFDKERLADKKFQTMFFDILNRYKDKIDFVIMCDNCLTSMFALAEYTRANKFPKDIKVICVTGSIGKTSTTEMVYSIFKQKNKIFRGDPMVNLRLRINHKLIEAESDCEYLLFECSGATKGYLKKFSELLIPDGIILTKVGTENLGVYGSIENIAKEKCSLMTCLRDDSLAVLNEQDIIKKASEEYNCQKKFMKEGDYKLIKSDWSGSEFEYKNEHYKLEVVGEHQINNAIKAIELAKHFGIDEDSIKKGLREFRSVGSRWMTDNYADTTVVTDCPNNPSYETMLSCITTFLNIYKDAPKKRVIISGIRELGEYEKEVHLMLAQFLEKQPIDELICLEKEAKTVYDYILKNAPNIDVKYFDKPKDIDENDPFVQYLLSTMDSKQAILIKAQGIDPIVMYEKVRLVLNKVLKGQ